MNTNTNTNMRLVDLPLDVLLHVGVAHGAGASMSLVCREWRDMMTRDLVVRSVVASEGHARAFGLAVGAGRADLAELVAIDGTPQVSRGRYSTAEREGLTALELAADGGFVDLVDLLIEEDVASVPSSSSSSSEEGERPGALQMATIGGHVEVVDMLLRRGGIKYRVDSGALCHRPIFLAAVEGWEDVVRVLVDHWADVDERAEGYGWTPLQVAVAFGNAECARVMIDECHADVDGVDAVSQYSAIHHAVVHGRRDLLELLLDRGADVDARDRVGDTALHLAVRSEPSMSCGIDHGGSRALSLASVLLEYGADPHAVNDKGRTPLCVLRRLGGDPEIVELLGRYS